MGNHLFQPDEPLGETPLTRTAARIGTASAILVLLGIIAFVSYESAMDYTGRPLYEEPPREPATHFQAARSAPEGLTIESIAAEAEALVESISKEFEFITPVGNVIVEGGRPLPVICLWRPPRRDPDARPPIVPTLEADFQPVQWRAIFGRNAWYAELELGHGKHTISTAGNRQDIFVRDLESDSGEKAPSHWKPLAVHPDTADPDKCADCHRLEPVHGMTPWKSDAFSQHDAIVALRGHTSCMDCHPSLEFELKHQHILEPLRDCELCHAIHGTTIPEKGLLKRPKVELCSQCHDPDH